MSSLRVKVFYATDIHGSEKCFRKFLNAQKIYGVNILILGGDITGKMLIPIIEKHDGSYEAEFMGSKVSVRAQDELKNLIKNIADTGSYPYLCDEDEYYRLSTDKFYLDRIFKEQVIKRIECWIKLAEERLYNLKPKPEVYIMPGNDDYPEVGRVLENSNLIINPEEKIVELGGKYEMISIGFSNITPWRSPRETSEEKLEEKLENLASKLKRVSESIFNVHIPPHNTPIDLAPLLDNTLKPILSGGQLLMTHVGSIAVRRVIEKYQPLVGLHGHIHESRGIVKIGKTLCVNPGSDYLAGNLQGAILTLENGKVKTYILTVG
ncbi:MAG: phosphoesterase [Desulfurococcaceae archaeon]